MTNFRVDRKFLDKKDAAFVDFLTPVCANVSTKPAFASIAAKATALQTKIEMLRTAYIAVDEGDKRQMANRDKYRREAEAQAREIADAVNLLANGDETIIVAAGFIATSTPSRDREMGETTLVSVEYFPKEGKVRLRCRKADRAADYQIDVSTDGKTWEEGVDSMPLTLFYIKWKMPKGDYFIRLCPRDNKGDRGTSSNMLPITIY